MQNATATTNHIKNKPNHLDHVLHSRHFWVSCIAIAALVAVGLYHGTDVSWPLASIAIGHGITNAGSTLAKAKKVPNGQAD